MGRTRPTGAAGGLEDVENAGVKYFWVFGDRAGRGVQVHCGPRGNPARRVRIACVSDVSSKETPMRNRTRVSRWGNSLAARIPLAITRQAVALALDVDGGIVLRPTRRRYKLSELVARITPKNRHRETDWGQPQGEESW